MNRLNGQCPLGKRSSLNFRCIFDLCGIPPRAFTVEAHVVSRLATNAATTTARSVIGAIEQFALRPSLSSLGVRRRNAKVAALISVPNPYRRHADHVSYLEALDILSQVDLSRICAAPSSRLGHLAFEGQGAFTSQC